MAATPRLTVFGWGHKAAPEELAILYGAVKKGGKGGKALAAPAAAAAADGHPAVGDDKGHAPLFVGRAPHEGRLASGHSYTPAKPVLPRSLSTSSSLGEAQSSVAGDLITPTWSLPAKPGAAAAATAGPDAASPDRGLKLPEPIMVERAKISAAFTQFTCYDLIPESGKIVVLDTKLKVKKAFAALVHHGIRAAVLWDSSSQQYVGMITVSDFINILRKYYVSPLVKIEELEDHQIQTWRDITAVDKFRPDTLVCIDPNASLYDAVVTLRSSRVHRLPVIDNRTGNALYIATLSKILRYARQVMPWDVCPKLMASSVKELGIGTVKNVAAVSEDTPLISVLNIFSERRISALPVISSEGTVLDIYVKTDAIMLARDRTYNNLDVPVSVALKARHAKFDGVRTCSLDDSLSDVLDRMVENDLHRLIIVDPQQRLIGVLSLSDILSLFIV
mmetsp:Transcript_27631/g.82752  ORF Transcript_27631/g.82752 Transcript_27631/m.82752 type:complete len:448 (+) Transcript_27631:71-1414(+)